MEKRYIKKRLGEGLLGSTIYILDSDEFKKADEQQRDGPTERVKHLQPILATPLTKE